MTPLPAFKCPQNKTSNESIDALASRAKSLCLQGQFGRAAKVLSSDGVAPENAATLNELKMLHLKESNPITNLIKMLTRMHFILMRQQYSPESSRSPNLLQLGRQKCIPSFCCMQ